MKILFGTCVAGNGHQTQAIAIKQFLAKENIDVTLNFAGASDKKLPAYFENSFNLFKYDGIDFVYDKMGRVIIWKTFLHGMLKTPKIVYSLYKIVRRIKKEKPDVVFNFYEPLVGLSALFCPSVKYVSFGHQYAMTSPKYPKIKGYYSQKTFFWLLNKITALRASKIAISYYKFEDDKLDIWPPVLRQETYVKSNEETENFVLVYLMNEAMVPNLLEEAKKYPEMQFECFTKTESAVIYENVKVFPLNGPLFLNRMKTCKGVVCSGGFETSAEAIYHNKPLLMIPTPNHFEQHANCVDAMTHGYSCFSNKLRLAKLPLTQKNEDVWFLSVEKKMAKLLNILRNK